MTLSWPRNAGDQHNRSLEGKYKCCISHLGPVTRTKVSANHGLRSIETDIFLRQFTLSVSPSPCSLSATSYS